MVKKQAGVSPVTPPLPRLGAMADMIFGSGMGPWVCPNDRQLALRAKLQTGWSVHTFQTEKQRKMQALSPKELEVILGVIRKAEQLDVVEQQRIGRLVERLENMRKNAMGNGLSQCLLCGETLGLMGSSSVFCQDCKKKVCTKCGIETVGAQKRPLWLCKICSEQRELIIRLLEGTQELGLEEVWGVVLQGAAQVHQAFEEQQLQQQTPGAAAPALAGRGGRAGAPERREQPLLHLGQGKSGSQRQRLGAQLLQPGGQTRPRGVQGLSREKAPSRNGTHQGTQPSHQQSPGDPPVPLAVREPQQPGQ
ncbi:rab effector Noc2 isoform X6 [Chamaea fasciata]|uniref:rab effector Noc2 isoform X6 n=1 Tax=Chamaea fasciata TaxID=190680 RepID=UPI00336AD403